MLKYKLSDISSISADNYRKCFDYMQKERKEKVLRYRNISQKKCTLAGEWLVRNMLSELTGQSIGSFVISADEKGKLHSITTPHLFFNISHSENMVAAAVSDISVGIDIEKIRQLSMKVARRVCTSEELYYVFGCSPAETDFSKEYGIETVKRFLEIWTIKEAYFKCIGTGITDFKSIDALSGQFYKKRIKDDDYIIHIVTM